MQVIEPYRPEELVKILLVRFSECTSRALFATFMQARWSNCCVAFTGVTNNHFDVKIESGIDEQW